jgi:serine/threonine protein kinase
MFRLSRSSGQLPPRLNVAGVAVPRMDRAICLGGFADIFLGSLGEQAVAVKRLRVQTTAQQYALHAMFCKEALIWRQLRHPHVLPFIGIDAETFRPFLCMVSPWLPHGNVLKYMERMDPLEVDVHRLVSDLS